MSAWASMWANVEAATPDEIVKLGFCQIRVWTMAGVLTRRIEMHPACSLTISMTRPDGVPRVSKANVRRCHVNSEEKRQLKTSGTVLSVQHNVVFYYGQKNAPLKPEDHSWSYWKSTSFLNLVFLHTTNPNKTRYFFICDATRFIKGELHDIEAVLKDCSGRQWDVTILRGEAWWIFLF